MAAPQTDYVKQNALDIEKLLREAGSGKLDRDIDSTIRNIEKKHAELHEVNNHRRWSFIRSEMLQAARKLKDQSLKEIDQLRKAKEFIRRHNGSQSRQAMVDRIITRLTSTRSQLDRNIGGLTRMGLPSAGFDGKQLRPTSNEQFFQLAHPGDKDGGMHPAPFRFTGPAGSVVTMEMKHVRSLSYGGHGHDIAPEHLGTFRNMNAPKFETLSAGKVRFSLRDEKDTTLWYQPSDVCTRRKFTVTHTWSDAMLRYVLFVDVRYAKKLYDLNDYDLKYLQVTTGDDYHPDTVCHYGSKEMIEAIEKLNHAYGRALENGEFDVATTETGEDNSITVTYRKPNQRQLWVNDLSLSWGGTFKCYGHMTNKAHETHKWGNDVDINYGGMNSKQKQWMWKNAPAFFKKVDTHSKGKSNEHWHFDMD